MTTAQDKLKELLALKDRNLAFFKKYFPEIHSLFATRAFKYLKLNIDPKTLTLELLKDDKALYKGDIERHAKDEAKLFSDAFRSGNLIHPLRHSYVGEFRNGRFSHAAIENFLIDVGAVAGSARPYIFEHTLPQVVFLGSGSGLHIKELMAIRPIRHGILVEHDPDKFLSSLYMTDWEELIMPFILDKDSSFNFSVGDTTASDEYARVMNAFAGAWNAACINVPFMPTQTVYYVHQADPFYTKVSERLNDEIEAYINVWGYYDDEINQLNHVMHNFEKNIPILKKTDFSNDNKITLICGNGPSLDDYIDIIKKYRSRINLISAGSTTHTLVNNDIYPDCNITLESDLDAYEDFTLLDSEKSKKIPIIGAAQIHPHTFDLYGQGLIYLKQETAYAEAFAKENETISTGTPTATNAALAIVLDLKLPNVYMVGMDYGFAEGKEAHAKDSFYYETDKTERFQKFHETLDADAYLLEENQYGKIYTTPFYNTGRSHCQRKIRESGREDLINLSQGATIEHTIFGDTKMFTNVLEQCQDDTQNTLIDQLIKNSRNISPKEIKNGLNALRRFLTESSQEMLVHLNQLEANRESIDNTVFRINQVIMNKTGHLSGRGNFPMLIRGSTWFWLFNYYALTKQVDRQNQISEITAKWKIHFGNYLEKLPEHFDQFLKDRSDNDAKLKLRITDKEPDLDEFLL